MRSRHLLLCAALFSSVVHGAADPSENIRRTLSERFPDVQIEHVAPAPWLGLYEVVTAGEIAYTNADATLLISGNVMDTKTRENLTLTRWNALHAIPLHELPLGKAIKIVKGDGSRVLAVFSDPECPYCQQLEQTLLRVDDVTVYVLLYPLENVHPTAREKAEKIWCAEDRVAAWSAWMLKQQEPSGTVCQQTPIAELLQLGARFEVTSTPTLVFANGHRVAGALSAEELERQLTAATVAERAP